MKAIYLKNGMFALVDNDDYERINAYNWIYLNKGDGYARRSYQNGGRQITVLMHRTVMNLDDDQHIDHVNGNTLDNRKINLRICDRSQNMANRKMHKNNKSGFKGVYQHHMKNGSKAFEAKIQFRKKSKSIGYFKTAKEASDAYDNESKKLHGEFSRPNSL